MSTEPFLVHIDLPSSRSLGPVLSFLFILHPSFALTSSRASRIQLLFLYSLIVLYDCIPCAILTLAEDEKFHPLGRLGEKEGIDCQTLQG